MKEWGVYERIGGAFKKEGVRLLREGGRGFKKERMFLERAGDASN